MASSQRKARLCSSPAARSIPASIETIHIKGFSIGYQYLCCKRGCAPTRTVPSLWAYFRRPVCRTRGCAPVYLLCRPCHHNTPTRQLTSRSVMCPIEACISCSRLSAVYTASSVFCSLCACPGSWHPPFHHQIMAGTSPACEMPRRTTE